MVFVVVLGVGGITTFHKTGIQANIGVPLLSDDPILGNTFNWTIVIDGDEPVTQSCDGVLKSVEAGWLGIYADIPDPLPICVTTCYLNDEWSMYAFSYGGYEPDIDGETVFILDQDKTGAGGTVTVTWEECGMVCWEDICIYVDGWDCWCGWCWPSLDIERCCFIMYEASFEVDDAIQLASNELPELCGCVDNIVPCDDFDLDKDVLITLYSDWAGCDDPCQSFEVLLAQKNYFHDVPQLV